MPKKDILDDRPDTVLRKNVYDALMEEIEQISNRTYEQVGAEVCRIFQAGKSDIRNVIRRSVESHKLNKKRAARLLRVLAKDLESGNSSGFTVEYLRSLLEKDQERP